VKISHVAKNATLEKLPQWKITNIVDTRCQSLRLNRTKFDFSWPLPQTSRQRSLDPLAGFKGSF